LDDNKNDNDTTSTMAERITQAQENVTDHTTGRKITIIIHKSQQAQNTANVETQGNYNYDNETHEEKYQLIPSRR